MASRRRRSSKAPLVVFLLIVVAAGAFFLWRTYRPQVTPATTATLHAVRFADLPGWKDSDARAALSAFRRSCSVLKNKPQNSAMGENGYAGIVGDWQSACNALPTASTAAAARQFFEQHFAPVEIAPDGGAALFTGYYEPELDASRTQGGAYKTPIYAAPPNLVSVDLGAFRGKYAGEHLEGCLAGHKLLPCASRAQIDAHGLANAPVLLYAKDPISVFFLHIQGSGRVKLADGTMLRIAYDGQNGRPYTAIGHTLIERGLLPREGMSMQAIRAWMKTHPALARNVMESDKSYVFFKEEPIGDAALGSPGSEGVPLTPGASLAVDTRLHPLGVPVYVAATRPDADPAKPDRAFDALLIAQDTGGAIRGPARGDVFWGFGPDAESIAGRMKSTGRMFVLLPKAVAAKLPPNAQLAAP
ncbi:MAG TPA: murein transglycosylase A [Rhizomicrobium sp.]|jgi:membrane-bound lytic murein transglycosylase A